MRNKSQLKSINKKSNYNYKMKKRKILKVNNQIQFMKNYKFKIALKILKIIKVAKQIKMGKIQVNLINIDLDSKYKLKKKKKKRVSLFNNQNN